MKARVLVLSATTGYQLRSFGEAAARLGFELTFATDRCHRLDDPWQDHAVPVRFHEPDASVDAIVRAAAERPIDGLIAVGDRPVVLAARVAEALGLPGNPPEAAAASANKLATRARLAAAGLRAPWHVSLDLTDPDPFTQGSGIRYPCVLKPIGLSGSRGVIRADTPGEARAALARIRALLSRKDVRAARSGLEGTVIVEGYIPGREYALEGALTDGRLQTFAVFEKPDPLEGPFFEETIYLTPPELDPRAADELERTVERAAGVIGLRNGPLHAELRLSPQGWCVVEIAARPIGGLCSKVLRFGAGDVSLEEVLLRQAAGHDISAFQRERRAAGVMMIPIPRKGLLRRVEGEAEAGSVAGIESVQITAKRDQLLEPLPEAGSYLGFIFARGASVRDVDDALRAAHTRMRFIIDAPIRVTAATHEA